MRALTRSLLLIAVLSQAACQVQTVEADPGTTGVQGATVASFPLRYMGSRPLIDVTLNGKGPFTFILDTGAEYTLVDSTLAGELALPVTGEKEVSSPLGKGQVVAEVVAVAQIAVGDLVFEDQQATLFDLAGLMPMADAPRGVLSYRMFQDLSVVFDFPSDELRLLRGGLAEPNGKDVFGFGDGLPELPLRIAGREQRVHLDTGSPGGLTLPLSAAEQLPLESAPTIVGRARTVDAELDIYRAKLDGAAEIGELRFDSPEINFIEGAPVGNLGNAILRGLVVTIDPTHNRVRLEQASDGPRRVVKTLGGDRKRYGIRLRGLDGDALTVAGVDSGSPAEEGKTRAGDVIIKMNGRPVGQMSRDERIRALQGSPLVLVVRRGETELTLTMSLGD